MAALLVIVVFVVTCCGSLAAMTVDGGCFLFADSARCTEMGPGMSDPVRNISSVTLDTRMWVPTAELLLRKFPDVTVVTCLQPAGSCTSPDFAVCPCLAHQAFHEADEEEDVIRITVTGDTWTVALPSFGSGLFLAGGLAILAFRCWNERRRRGLGSKTVDLECAAAAELATPEPLDLAQVGTTAPVAIPAAELLQEPVQSASDVVLLPPTTSAPAVNAVHPLTPAPPPPPPLPSLQRGNPPQGVGGAPLCEAMSRASGTTGERPSAVPQLLRGPTRVPLLSLLARSPMLHRQSTVPAVTPLVRMPQPGAVALVTGTPPPLRPKPEVTPKGAFVISTDRSFHSLIRERARQRRGGASSSDEE